MESYEETVKRLEAQGMRVVPREKVRNIFRGIGIVPEDRVVTEEERKEVSRILSKAKIPLDKMILMRRGDR